MIQAPRGDLGGGAGTAAMQDLVNYADKNGQLIYLSVAEKDRSTGTTSKSRLKKFYKRFGFVDNRGRNKDFSLSRYADMYRMPRSISEEAMMEEKVVQAAFYDPEEDMIYPSGREHDLIALLDKGLPDDKIEKILQPANQGFLTNLGHWIDRKTAAILTHTGLRNREHEMDSSEIPNADPFDELPEPVHSRIAEKKQ